MFSDHDSRLEYCYEMDHETEYIPPEGYWDEGYHDIVDRKFVYMSTFFTAYRPYPFPTIEYKIIKNRRLEQKQDLNHVLLVNMPRDIIRSILIQLPFSAMKAMAATCISFHKLLNGHIAEEALRLKYLKNTVAVENDIRLGIDIVSMPTFPKGCTNRRFWWTKTKNAIAFHRFIQRVNEKPIMSTGLGIKTDRWDFLKHQDTHDIDHRFAFFSRKSMNYIACSSMSGSKEIILRTTHYGRHNTIQHTEKYLDKITIRGHEFFEDIKIIFRQIEAIKQYLLHVK